MTNHGYDVADPGFVTRKTDFFSYAPVITGQNKPPAFTERRLQPEALRS